MRSNSGFTILEVVVALSIMAVGIMAIMQLFPISMQQQHRSAERSAVASLARSELGRVRAGGVFSQSDLRDYMVRWAEENALRTLTEAERAYALYDSWRSSVQRVSSPFGDQVSLFRVTFSVRLFDGAEEKFVTYVTEL